MSETHENRLKRLAMRAHRRGTKEMDLILGTWAESELTGLDAARLDLFEALLSENDHDLYAWVTGTAPAPERFAGLIADIARVVSPQAMRGH